MSVPGTTSGPELLVHLDRGRREPLHRQLADGLRDAIRAGRLAEGSRLPSSRVLATDLGVSRRLVVEAYDQLTAEGFLISRAGSGTRVAAVDGIRASVEPPVVQHRYDVDFRPGSPDLGAFPRDAWLRALRVGLARTPSEALGYGAPQGMPVTRAALADYLRRTRGVQADAQHLVLTSGVTQAVALLTRVLGGRPVATEDPGFWLHRMVFEHNGVEPLPVPVDGEGIDVAELAASGAGAVLTTPAHHSPTGVVMTPARRAALLDWARAGNLVIEDDYDAEYRYDRAPVGALQGMAPDRVVYVGSTSKTLAPGLRIGWMVLPGDLVGPITVAKGLADSGGAVMEQIALAEMLTSGGYDRHLRQMRRQYMARRNALLRRLSRDLPEAEILGAAAGLHLTVHLPPTVDVDDLVRRAAQMRVRVEALAPCYHDAATAPPGLILGYANLTETQISEGVRVLAQALGGGGGI